MKAVGLGMTEEERRLVNQVQELLKRTIREVRTIERQIAGLISVLDKLISAIQSRQP